jgi:hypothetical protein
MISENIYYVYRHYKKDTNEVFYIGRSKTKNFKRAYQFQCRQRNIDWCKVYEEYGVDADILCCNMSDDDSAELEEFIISIYGRVDLNEGNLTNKCNGGKTSKGMIRSEEYRANQSKNLSGRYVGENNPFFNKIHSEEALIKMRKPREALKDGGHFRSKEVINVITGVVYSNVRIASEKENVGYSSLRGYLRGSVPNPTPLLYINFINYFTEYL